MSPKQLILILRLYIIGGGDISVPLGTVTGRDLLGYRVAHDVGRALGTDHDATVIAYKWKTINHRCYTAWDLPDPFPITAILKMLRDGWPPRERTREMPALALGSSKGPQAPGQASEAAQDHPCRLSDVSGFGTKVKPSNPSASPASFGAAANQRACRAGLGALRRV